jgi:hypothetical protein
VTLLEQLRSAWRPLAAWYASLLIGVAAFVAVLAASGDLEGEGAQVLLVIVSTSILGSLLGTALGLARVRELWIVAAGLADGFASTLLLAAVAAQGGPGDALVLVWLVLYFLPIALTGGYWAITTNRALFSLWHPVVYFTGAVIVWIDDHKGITAWSQGQKVAVWDTMSSLLVALMVLTVLVYLAAQEGHRLALWRRGPRAALPASQGDHGDVRPRTDLRAWAVLAAIGAALTLATLAIAPWFWRTGPSEGNGGGSGSEPQEPPPDLPDMGWAERIGEALRQLMEGSKEAAGALCNALAILLMLGLLALALWRPVRRALWMRHLRKPFWDMPPTRRIEQAWRAVEIALEDIGVVAQRGEDAIGLARRALPALEKLSPVEAHGLEECAVIVDRVRFGLGVQPGDEESTLRFARWACDTIWERMGDGAQIRAMYRRL